MMIRIARMNLLALVLAPTVTLAQDIPQDTTAPKHVTKFFDSETPLAATLTTNIKQIRNDKKDEAPWRAASIQFAGADGQAVVLPIRVRTRGIWRLNNCEFPPLRLNFVRVQAQGTVFEGLDKPKLVNYCRNNDRFEQYVLQELQLYRVYQLLTPASHRARLVHMTYVDSASGKTHAKRMAIIVEEPDAMAERLGGQMLEQQGADKEDLDPQQNLLFGVFQYFAANTDWSTLMLHNVELVVRRHDGALLPVAFDFDFSGAVNAPYATPDPKIPIRHVRQRLYRGMCATPEQLAAVFALFNQKKDAIYALYRDDIGKLLLPEFVRETLDYYDQFYATINDPKKVKREFVEGCRD
ncbi:MAG TPA: hypothetical protein VJ672_10020 [Gemmatimonadaceae bacterium]|nr:hypothetical protein [Gemmatimonadaceae bacterium]